jgi:uncharacterized protein (UPF0332 family)
MKSTAFLSLAERLAKGTSPEEYRSAVSRAYYGAFHVAMELLLRVGIRLPASPEAHQKLRFCLLQCGELAGVEAGEKLESLRKQRNYADYDLGHARSDKQENALFQVDVAREIVDALNLCREEPVWSRLRAKVRAYAADTLRLTVVD